MFRTLLSLTLAAASLPACAHPDRPEGRESRKAWKHEDKEDRRFWRERDKAERKYWKEREKQARQYERHRYHDDDDNDDDDHRPRARRHRAPSWMNGYWRQDDTRRYVALVPGDPSRMYVFLEGRWVLRQIRDPRARLDLEGAFRLPVAPPPIAPPRIGLDLHVVLFD